MPDVFEGSTYVFSGRWAVHNRFGRQVALESARFVQPTGVAEIEAYLVSSVKHVGKVTAKRLTDAFGMDVLRVLDMPNSEAMLVSVPGIGASTAAKIASSWGSSRDLREALDFLTDHGVSSTMAYRIANTYGEDTQRVVKERPFGATSGVRGMRWDDQVKLANALRMPPHCTDRYGTALRKVLGAGMGYGHTCLPQSRLMAKAGELLEQHLPPEEVHKPELLVEALAERAARTSDARTQRVASKGRDTGAGSGVEVVSFDAGEPMCYLPHVWEAEGGLARSFVQRMTRQASPRTRAARQVHANEATAWLKENFTTLSDQQRGVVVEAARSDMLVINGGPGSGKTYLLAAMSKFFRSVGKVRRCAGAGAGAGAAIYLRCALRIDAESSPVLTSRANRLPHPMAARLGRTWPCAHRPGAQQGAWPSPRSTPRAPFTACWVSSPRPTSTATMTCRAPSSTTPRILWSATCSLLTRAPCSTPLWRTR